MVRALVLLGIPVGPAPGGDVDLAADDGADPFLFCGLVEVNGPVHHPVVGDGHRLLAQLLGPGHQLVQFAGPVQQAVLGMAMQMNKIRHEINSR